MSPTPVLVPIVRWAQNIAVISLKIELIECKNPKIDLKPEYLNFESIGIGAKGENPYGFTIEFWKNVMAESVVHKVNGSCVEIFLSKEKAEWWPQLTKVAKSPHFLKVDFDKWRSESDDEEERKKKAQNDILEELHEEKENFEHTLVKLKTGYLVTYNAIQWLIHLYILLFCIINMYRGGSEVFAFTYAHCGKSVQLAVALSWIEAINPYAGITKGSWVTPFVQCYGRSFAIFCLWLTAESIMYDWYVTILFMSWSAIEFIRYPLYICQLTMINSKFLTWLRYSVWIPLYPVGTAMEVLLFCNAMSVIAADNMYEMQLPNTFNIILKFTWYIRLHVAGLIYVVAFTLMPYMWKQRQRRLGGRKKYKQP